MVVHRRGTSFDFGQSIIALFLRVRFVEQYSAYYVAIYCRYKSSTPCYQHIPFARIHAMFSLVIEIDDLDGSVEAFLCKIPYP